MMSISKNKYKLLILLIAFYLPSMGQGDAKMIFTKAMDQLLTVNMEMSMEVTETDIKGRVKEKSFDILMAKFGELEKTRMTMQKPERAKGVTIIVTHLPDETGIVEVFTPANGKTRKMKATPENMARVGSNFSLSNFASIDLDDLIWKPLGKQEVDGRSCYQVAVTAPSDSTGYNAEFLVEESTFHIVQVLLFDENGNQTSSAILSDYQPVAGLKDKIQPMLILAEDMESNKHTRMEVVNISPRSDLKEEDFLIQGVSQ